MKFVSERQEDIDGRKPGDPHPHWETNRDYLQVFLNLPTVKRMIFDSNNPKHTIKNMLQVVWNGVNKDNFGNFEFLTCCQIHWHGIIPVFGKSFIFHQTASRFKEEVDIFFTPLKEKARSMDQLCL